MVLNTVEVLYMSNIPYRPYHIVSKGTSEISMLAMHFYNIKCSIVSRLMKQWFVSENSKLSKNKNTFIFKTKINYNSDTIVHLYVVN